MFVWYAFIDLILGCVCRMNCFGLLHGCTRQLTISTTWTTLGKMVTLLVELDGAWVSQLGCQVCWGLDTCGQGNNSWTKLYYLICFFRNMLHVENHMSIWTSLYDNLSIKNLNHVTRAWIIGFSISFQFLMQGKAGGNASIFEKYQEKTESFMSNCRGKGSQNVQKTPSSLIFHQRWKNMQFVNRAFF